MEGQGWLGFDNKKRIILGRHLGGARQSAFKNRIKGAY